MADMNVKRTQQSGAQGREVTQTQQQAGLSRRRQFDPFFSLMPADLFNMNPFSLMRHFTDEMDRAFYNRSEQGERGASGTWVPAIEVSERNNNYVVCAELPGINKDNVDVELTDEALVIRGERRFENTSEEGGVHRSERRYGQFYRSIPLPENVNADQAKANFRDGVLEVSIPMTEQKSNTRKIPIQGGTGSTSQTSTQQGSTQHSSTSTGQPSHSTSHK